MTKKLIFSVLLTLSLCCVPLVSKGLIYAASYEPPLNPVKTLNLMDDIEPNTAWHGCQNTSFSYGDPLNPKTQSGCVYTSPLGDVSLGSYQWLNGPDGWRLFDNKVYFLPRSASGEAVLGMSYGSTTGWSLMNYGVLDSVTDLTTTLKWDQASGTSSWYQFKAALSPTVLSYPSGKSFQVADNTIQRSNNGRYITTYTYSSNGNGLSLIDTVDGFQPKVFAWAKGFSMTAAKTGFTVKGDTMAVSDDGRFVAATGTVLGKPSLRIYDLSTCENQISNSGTAIKNCTFVDVWNGKYESGLATNGSMKAAFPTAEYPRSVAFEADGRVSLSSVYDRVSTTSFKVARFSVVNPLTDEAKKEPIHLMALGDSYISGEGAERDLFGGSASHYLLGTNTSNNKCHNSDLSYPYLLAHDYADSFHSVACSGAVTNDITNGSPDYINQSIPKVKRLDLSDDTREGALQNYYPGVINQLRFIIKDTPNTILLSVGGNDIGFAKIVERCVIGMSWSPCYEGQSERIKLLNTVYKKHNKLVDTYTKIINESASSARLYVMGYPRVVNTAGSCGANVRLDDAERQFADALILLINRTIKNAAESSGAVYVDIADSLAGYRLCDPQSIGVNGLTAGDDKGIGFTSRKVNFGLGNESYHPTAYGHRLISQTVANRTDQLTKLPSAPNGARQLSIYPLDYLEENFIFSAKKDASNDEALKMIRYSELSQANLVKSGQKQTIDTNLDPIKGKPGASYKLTYRSEPVLVAEGYLDETGELMVEINVPNLEPGLHELHLEATGEDGEPMDYVQNIYIMATESDNDGDGIANEVDELPFINELGRLVLPTKPEVDESATDSVDVGQSSVEEPTVTDKPNSEVVTVLKGSPLSAQAVMPSEVIQSAATFNLTEYFVNLKNQTPVIDSSASYVLGVSVGNSSGLSKIVQATTKTPVFARPADTKTTADGVYRWWVIGGAVLSMLVWIFYKLLKKHRDILEI